MMRPATIATSTITPVNPRDFNKTSANPASSFLGAIRTVICEFAAASSQDQAPRNSAPLCAGERQLDQRANRDAARALREVRFRLFSPRGPGDVDVRPRETAGELLQEQRGCDRARRPPARVRHVGDVALDLIAVVVEQR